MKTTNSNSGYTGSTNKLRYLKSIDISRSVIRFSSKLPTPKLNRFCDIGVFLRFFISHYNF